MCKYCQMVQNGAYQKVFDGAKADIYQGRDLNQWIIKVSIHICPPYSNCCQNHEHFQAYPIEFCLNCGRNLVEDEGNV